MICYYKELPYSLKMIVEGPGRSIGQKEKLRPKKDAIAVLTVVYFWQWKRWPHQGWITDPDSGSLIMQAEIQSQMVDDPFGLPKLCDPSYHSLLLH
jgi:hypothetical protein